jgi:formylglycine-generating enzyme required for sulfatase activity
MTRRSSNEPALVAADTSSAAADRGRLVGIVVLGVIVVFVTIWMYVRGRAAIAATVLSAPRVESNDARFNVSAWNLPNEPMLGFVEIPAGVFTMGSDPAVDQSAYENERWSGADKQGGVELPTFYIARFEVTVAQFAAFVAATNRAVDSQTLSALGNHPVSNVRWTDALAYAQWLETQMPQSTQTPAALAALLKGGWHVSLPNEAQWEKAARGVDGRTFPWGNGADQSKANFAHSGTMPVGSFECSECAFGLADMSGNVWELTRSPLQSYPYDDEARDPHADALFVMRGGAFNDAANNVRTATRGGIDPGARRPFIGFRLVLSKS